MRRGHFLAQAGEELVLTAERLHHRRHAGALHARELHRGVVLHKAAEQRRDLGAGAIAREQAALVHPAVRAAEQLADLGEARRSLADGLVLVAQHEEVGAAEVACQHHELGERVVLNLVDHHEARVGVAAAGHKKTQVEPLARTHALGAEHAHGDAVEPQPAELVHLVVRGGEALLEPPAREGEGLVLGLGAHGLAEEAHLLVHIQAEHLLLELLVARHARDAAVHAVVQVVGHQGAEARPHAELGELVHCALDLVGLEHHGLAAANLTQVGDAEGELSHAGLERREGRRVAPLAQVAPARAELLAEVPPGVDLRVRLAHGGQDVVDVVLEDGVGAKEVHLAGAERLALAVEQKGDALQHHGGLARAGDAVHEQRGHVGVAHDLVLLTLDGGRDVLELLGVVAAQGAQKQRVLDGHRGVEVHVEHVARDGELAAQLQLDGAGAAVDGVGGLAVLLVVVGLGHGVSPVHDERSAALVGHAGGADVDVAGRAVGRHLEADLGEVGLAKEQQQAAQLVHAEVVVLVVGVDDGVERLDGGERLHDLVGLAGDVGADLVGEGAQVLGRARVAAFELVGQLVAHGAELGIYLAEVRLLLGKDGVVGLLRLGDALFARHMAPLARRLVARRPATANCGLTTLTNCPRRPL